MVFESPVREVALNVLVEPSYYDLCAFGNRDDRSRIQLVLRNFAIQQRLQRLVHKRVEMSAGFRRKDFYLPTVQICLGSVSLLANVAWLFRSVRSDTS